MAITDTLEDVRSYLADVKKKHRYKKARLAREAAVELQASLAQCRGKLEICKKDLNRSINTQSRNIREGLEKGNDTIIQEQILWDAAIGYMLVSDAIYALETITSYDAVSHAYEMLDAAMKQMTGKKNSLPASLKARSSKERNSYGYITSSAAVRDKEALLDGFFEQLKLEGDIEKQLARARTPAARQAERRYSYAGDGGEGMTVPSDLDDRMARLERMQNAAGDEELDINLGNLQSITPPTDL